MKINVIENGKAITRDMTPEEEAEYIKAIEEAEYIKAIEPTAEQKASYEKARKIAEYKAYLEKTDYIVLKIAEAQSEGDTNKVTHLRTLYKSELEERKKMRDLLNR